ncbi:hypothetical protein K438DRAFT_1754385 [Mycena galopus ATCC 62051]|nr:hypothetical protein K438DRAFT_1754385 [Mycena galopus ATCC 62051]
MSDGLAGRATGIRCVCGTAKAQLRSWTDATRQHFFDMLKNMLDDPRTVVICLEPKRGKDPRTKVGRLQTSGRTPLWRLWVNCLFRSRWVVYASYCEDTATDADFILNDSTAHLFENPAKYTALSSSHATLAMSNTPLSIRTVLLEQTERTRQSLRSDIALEESELKISSLESQTRSLPVELRDRECACVAAPKHILAPIHVCENWRQVAHGTPQLFTRRIQIDLRDYNEGYADGLKAWLARSTPLPIPISFEMRWSTDISPRMLEDFLSIAPQCRSLQLKGWRRPSHQLVIGLAQSGLNILEELDLGNIDIYRREETSGGGGQRRDVGSVGRKKRAFWGRGKHPGLNIAGRMGYSPRTRVEKGTMEALVHELIFATVFLSADAVGEEAKRREEKWRDYALTVLFSLPLVAGRARVEAEFVRCAAYLVAGTAPEEVEAQRARVAWMAREYLRFHVYSQQPHRVCLNGGHVHLDPDRQPTSGGNTVSPRPEGNTRMVGLLDAPGVREPIFPSSPAGDASLSTPRSPAVRGGLALRMPRAALETEGLMHEVRLALDSHVLARSLTLFHCAIIEQTSENPTAAFALDSAVWDRRSAALGHEDAAGAYTRGGYGLRRGAWRGGGAEWQYVSRPVVAYTLEERDD